jgi:hypothetical protein
LLSLLSLSFPLLPSPSPLTALRFAPLCTRGFQINGTLTSLGNDTDVLSEAVHSLEGTLNSSFPVLDLLSANLTALNASIPAVDSAISQLAAPLGGLTFSLAAMSSPQTGVSAAFAAAQSTTVYLPAQSVATSLLSQSPSVADLMSGSMNGIAGTADRLTLRGRLSAMLADILQVPRLSATAVLLSNVSSAIVAMRSERQLDAVDRSLVTAQAAIDALPPFVALRASVTAVQGLLESLSLKSLVDAVLRFNSTLSSVPSLDPIRDELNSFFGFGSVITCLENLAAAEDNLNASFASLPSVFSVQPVITSVNDSYAPALKQVQNFNASLSSLADSVATAPNFTDALQVREMSPR